MRSSTWLLAWVWWSVSSFAVAQQSPAPQPSAAAPAAAEPAPPSAAAQGSATPPPAQASPVVAPPAEGAAAVVVPAAPPAGCVPSCRSGYVCVSNQCVSACNPPCSIGDVCTAHGECVSRPSEPLPGVPPEADSGIHTHDGFFMRFTTGPGGGGVGLEIPDEADRSYGGGGWSGSFDIGGAVTRDLALFGRLRGVWIIEPEVRIGGDDVPGTEGLVVDMGLFGAGLNYYVMPLNLYFAGAIGFATVTTLRKE
ncbi:MAG TPA: hypothetical protein VJR89_25355, partial [Polyangiales bacterium]|nr:hypothetical protein [Polyangiales bacterium]